MGSYFSPAGQLGDEGEGGGEGGGSSVYDIGGKGQHEEGGSVCIETIVVQQKQ